jgi:predicted nucleotidyltransferase
MSQLDIIRQRREEILRLAEGYGIRRVRIFGSIARGEDRPESDIDVLVAFEPGRSLLDQVGFRQDLEEMLGRRVDVVSERGISPYLQDRILAEAVPL